MLSFNPDIHTRQTGPEVARIQSIVQRLHNTLRHDQVVQQTTDRLRDFLKVDRVVLYYFHKQWEGRVTFESLSDSQFSILGMTGPDQCFSEEYASLYFNGRVSATDNIETADIAPCHRDFLKALKVRSNLVVPILPTADEKKTLWGLLVAHHCREIRPWLTDDIEQMQAGAEALAKASSIRDS